MRACLLSILVAAAIAAPITAQKPVAPPPAAPVADGNSRLKSNQFSIVATGCIHGRRLQASSLEASDSVFATLRATEFVLQGPRELLQQIKDHHDGHHDQIEGIVSVPAAPDGASATTTTKEFGKTRVTLGGREEGKAYVQDPPKPLTIKVTSLTHLNEGCAPARGAL
jgi:hypothetical protein